MLRKPERSVFGSASRRIRRLGSVASRWTSPLTPPLKRRVHRAVSNHSTVRTVKLGVLSLDSGLLPPPCLACVVDCDGFGLVGGLVGGAGWFAVDAGWCNSQ